MKKELHLMIIWKNALFKKDEILEDLAKSFKIRNKFMIYWSKENFSKNLSRFYGTALPDNSFKEQHCGKGEFLLVIFEDSSPKYGYTETSHGKDYVNLNTFKKKIQYREITGGQMSHMIHTTNSPYEFNHDLTLLLGVNEKDFCKKYKPSDKEIKFKSDVIGTNPWNSIEEIFYVLNNTNEYVVLRDFENNLYDYVQKENINPNFDIDILSTNSEDAVWILNATRLNDTYTVNLKGNKVVYFDIKDRREGYYSEDMCDGIINSRLINKYFYVPNNEYHYYSSLYHALVHKFNFESEYNQRLEFVFGNKMHNSKKDKAFFIDKCSKWLIKNNYSIAVNIGNIKKFNTENVRQFSYELKPKEIIYKHVLLINQLDKINEEKNAEINKYIEEKDAYNKQLTEVLNSKSWKITKPLRAFIKLFKG